MEPIAYLRAPIRRWPVVVSIALIALIVALLVPVGSSSAYPVNTWRTDAQIGLTPVYHENALGARLGLKQLEFYSRSPVVLATAAKADGVPVTHGLSADIVVAKVKEPGAAGSILDVAVLQPTKYGAANLTNAFVAALSGYAALEFTNAQKTAISDEQAYIANLEKTIASLTKSHAGSSSTSLSTTSTTRPIVVKKKKVVVVPTTTTTTKTHSLAASQGQAALTAESRSSGAPGNEGSGAPQVVLVATTGSTIPTITATTVATGTATTVPASTGGTGTGALTTTPTTALTLNNRTLVEENRVLANELGQAQANLQRMLAVGVPPTGIRVIQPASPKRAVKLNPNPPLLSNDLLRGFLGLLIGALLGVVATWLLDAFDRRIRTSKRAEEVFGLPVIVEIPAPPAESVSPVPVVDVVVDPYSPASEAYRKLHVAILTAPPVTWVRRGYGPQEDLELAPRRLPEPLLVGAAPVQAPAHPGGVSDPSAATTEQTRLPVPAGPGGLAVPRRSRFAIMVTSPTDEPTRSLVVVNLAAVFAEAGDRVLVATTGGMRTTIDGNGKFPPMWEGAYADLSTSDLVANARPSQIPGVSSIALGQLFPNPSRLALNAHALVETARDVVDVLLLEASLLSSQDAAALMPAADLVVVVCEAWCTTVEEGLKSQRLLAHHRPPVLGLAMTNMQSPHPSLAPFSV